MDIELVTAGASEEEAFEVNDKDLREGPQVQLLVGLHVALALAAKPAVLCL